MDMFVAGGGIEEPSSGALVEVVLFGFLDWLKRRIRELLRAGRVSVPVPGANVSGPLFVWATACVAGIVVGSVGKMPTPPPPGAGKSLKVGS
jgi:hypothetical protein